MKIFFLILFVLNFTLFAEQLPSGWPWKGIDIMASSYKYDPKAIDFIVDEKIPYVIIMFQNNLVMKRENVNAQEALRMNLEWASAISKRLNKQNIKTIISFDDFSSDIQECQNSQSVQYWSNPRCIDSIYQDINYTLDFLKDNHILAYQFIAEPTIIENAKAHAPNNWVSIFNEMLKTVRNKDKSVYMIFEPGPWGEPKGYENFVPFNDNKIIYNMHMYAPQNFTHQGIKLYPDHVSYPGFVRPWLYWNKSSSVDYLAPLIKFQTKYNVPVSVCGFSSVRWAKERDQYLKDVIEIFKQNNWSWFYFNIGGFWKGWDIRYDAFLQQNGTYELQYNNNQTSTYKSLKKEFIQGNKQ
ncbi:cellulase family glycosylhydrolase [Sulfuricurvum sp.]|uniref:glycoside hydrolase family 5 protein n=1 Tax=Sulfuricurvum sp. TaxID=2025608 RepID=UPI00262E6433|nr:cellulase family glycosylhydrolase [Sulfuricurvum sp.]MDD4950733.1 cellulase family glycosylhydrolase [Sulfuricurvum sp.]